MADSRDARAPDAAPLNPAGPQRIERPAARPLQHRHRVPHQPGPAAQSLVDASVFTDGNTSVGGSEDEREHQVGAAKQLRELCFDDVRREPRARKSRKEKRPREEPSNAPEPPASRPARHMGPRVHLVNGQLVIDPASLVVRRGEEPDQSDYALMQHVDDTEHYATSASFTRRDSVIRWSASDTREFYRTLRMFGLDFGLIATHFPSRSRKQLKRKYEQERKRHPALVHTALTQRALMDAEKEAGSIADFLAKRREEKRRQNIGVGSQHFEDEEDEEVAPPPGSLLLTDAPAGQGEAAAPASEPVPEAAAVAEGEAEEEDGESDDYLEEEPDDVDQFLEHRKTLTGIDEEGYDSAN
jgi:hypothetical protein